MKLAEKIILMHKDPVLEKMQRFEHTFETGEFGDLSPSAMAKLLMKEQGNYKDAMASLQYFENRWGKKADNKSLKKIEDTRVELRKLNNRDVRDGSPKDKK